MMELTITGIDRSQPYQPGDVVAGTVKLIVSSKEKASRIQQVRGYLEGHCTVHRIEGTAQRREEFSSEVELFHQRQVLFAGADTLNGTHSWGIQFQLPETITVSKPPFFKLSKVLQSLFDGTKTQSLPPSMDVESRGHLGSTHCSISYVIKADMTLSGMGVSKVCSVNIPLLPISPGPHTMPRMLSYEDEHSTASLTMDPQLGVRKLSMMERLKTKLQNDDKLPRLQYILQCEMPDSAVVSEAIPIFLQAKLKNGNANSALPLIELRKCAIHVIRKISAASPGARYLDAAETFDVGTSIGSWDPRLEASYPGASSQPPVLLNNRIDVGQLMKHPLALHKKAFSPAFKTFNIGQSLHIAVIATIGIATEDVDIAIQSRPFTFHLHYNHTSDANVGISKAGKSG